MKLKLLTLLLFLIFHARILLGDAYVLNITAQSVYVINEETLNLVTSIFVGAQPTVILPIPNTSKMYVLNQTDPGSIKVIDTNTNTVSATINLPGGAQANLLAIAPDGSKAYVTYGNSTLTVIDIPSDSILTSFAMSFSNPSGLVVTPNSQRILVRFSADILIYDSNETLLASLSTGAFGSSNPIIVSSNGATAYTANNATNNLTILNIAALTVNPPIPLSTAANPGFIFLTPDNTKLYIANSSSNSLTIYNIASQTNLALILAASTADVVFSGSSKAYVSTPNSGNIYAINTTSSSISNTISTAPQLSPFPLGISLDGTKLFSSNVGSGTVSAYRVSDDSFIGLTTLGGIPFRMAFTATSVLGPDPTGSQNISRFLTQGSFFNLIKWSAPVSGFTPVLYRIYRDAGLTQLIGQVSANSPLEFVENGVRPSVTYTYFIQAVDGSNNTLLIGSVTIS